jgi:hypothetical protein
VPIADHSLPVLAGDITCNHDMRNPQVHSKGKRAFHPYSEISSEGRIDARIFTMDGDQVRFCRCVCLFK